MKLKTKIKSFVTLGLGLALGVGLLASRPANAQQLVPVVATNIVVTLPPVMWLGTNAQVIVDQLLSITNADGAAVVPMNFFSTRNATIIIQTFVQRTDGGSNVLAAIRAEVK